MLDLDEEAAAGLLDEDALLSVVLDLAKAVDVVAELDDELLVASTAVIVVIAVGSGKLKLKASLSLQQSPWPLPSQHHWPSPQLLTVTLPSTEPFTATPPGIVLSVVGALISAFESGFIWKDYRHTYAADRVADAVRLSILFRTSVSGVVAIGQSLT